MVGKSLSHYKIVAELGRGGMGIVYRAKDSKLDRTVAIKVLPSAALASENNRARVYLKAKNAAQLFLPFVGCPSINGNNLRSLKIITMDLTSSRLFRD